MEEQNICPRSLSRKKVLTVLWWIFKGRVPEVEHHLGVLEYNGGEERVVLELLVDGEGSAQVYPVFCEPYLQVVEVEKATDNFSFPKSTSVIIKLKQLIHIASAAILGTI